VGIFQPLVEKGVGRGRVYSLSIKQKKLIKIILTSMPFLFWLIPIKISTTLLKNRQGKTKAFKDTKKWLQKKGV